MSVDKKIDNYSSGILHVTEPDWVSSVQDDMRLYLEVIKKTLGKA